MAKSIMITEKGLCYICRRRIQTETHHIFEGANRKASEKFGLKLEVCRFCHNDIHNYPERFSYLKPAAQYRAMYVYEWTEDDFRQRFRKSYI